MPRAFRWLLVSVFALSVHLTPSARAQESTPAPPDPTTVRVPEGYRVAPYPAQPRAAPFGQVSAPARFVLPPRLATRMRLLEQSLGILGQRGSPVMSGITNLIIGGVSVTAGALLYEPERPSISIYMLAFGGLSVGTGIVELTIVPNPSTLATSFAAMPMTTREEARSRLRFGERALEQLAFRFRVARYLTSSLNTAGGLAMIPIYLAQRNFEASSPYDTVIFIGAAVTIITGAIGFFTQGVAERLYSSYEDLVEAQREQRRRPPGIEVSGAIVPMTGGAGVFARAAF
jgi:hypothetical protein